MAAPRHLKELSALPPEQVRAVLPELAQEARGPRKAALGRLINTMELGYPAVRLLGGCTLDYLAPLLAVDLLLEGRPFRVKAGAYDQVVQELQQQEEPYAVLVPWRPAAEDPEAEMVFWRTCWGIAKQRKIRLVQLSYDWVRPDRTGHRGVGRKVLDRLNEQLREELPKGHFFLDLGLVSGLVGRRRFYDARGYFWAKQPFSALGLDHLSRHLVAALRALQTGPKKVLVLDLDNTLWGGEVGEVGVEGLGLQGPEGEAFLAFQSYLKGLIEQGVLLAIASKNEESVALEALAHSPEMLLRPQDFVATEIHWKPKSESLRNIARKLNLGLDSFVFFDDNPREREEVKKVLPEVSVVEVSGDPVDYIDELQSGLYFETTEVTELDRSRTEQYRQQAQREEARETVEDYFEFLQMRARIGSVFGDNLARTIQLLARTNQFNLTTRRHGPEELEELASHQDSYLHCLQLEDRFGDLGIISVLLAVPESSTEIRIDTWVMSCRALQRTVEYRFFNHFMEHVKCAGFVSVLGEFLPTAKNRPVADLLPRLGFQKADSGFFVLEVESFQPLPTHVR